MIVRWKHDGGSLEQDPKPFKNDIDSTEMSKYVKDNKYGVNYMLNQMSMYEVLYLFISLQRINGKGVYLLMLGIT